MSINSNVMFKIWLLSLRRDTQENQAYRVSRDPRATR